MDEPTGARPWRTKYAGHRSCLRTLPLRDERWPRAGEQGPQGSFREVQRRQKEVHRSNSPRVIRLEDLQLRTRLRATAGGSGGIQMAPELRRLRDAMARRMH